MRTTLVFLHGLESGPHGSKYQALRELDPDLVAPDCEGITDMEERLAVIDQALAGMDRMVIVGSSFGGLAALLFAQKPGNLERIGGCVLCAPALNMANPGDIRSLPANTVIIHGEGDDVIPIAASEELHARLGGRLIRVEDDHRLSASRELLVEIVRDILASA